MPRYFNSSIRVNRVTFLSSSVFNVPPGVNLVYVTLVGGGGGGGSVTVDPVVLGDGASHWGGGGGGAGAALINAPIYVTHTESINIIIGMGGNSDQNGSPSIFGNYLIVSGGLKGNDATSSSGRGGNGASYSILSGGLGGAPNASDPPFLPGGIERNRITGSNGMFAITESISGGGTIFTVAAGGGGGGGLYVSSTLLLANFPSGGYAGSPFSNPFKPGFGSGNVASRFTGGGGGCSALGNGGAEGITPGFGGGGCGRGETSLIRTGSGQPGGNGFCSVAWD